MRKRQYVSKIMGEIAEIESSTHQLVSGNLDSTVSAEDYKILGELAEDINLISRTFNSYINEISHILAHLSAGNMAVSFSKNVDYKGDFQPIRNALHKIRHSLNSSFEEINLLSDEVDKLSSQVEEESIQIAQNAAEQAELINDLTGTIYQITEQTTNNAENAKRASNNINDIRTETEVGSDYMERMMGAIQKVQTSSQDISSIITIISGLAEQTRLLALNASIEAARAGDSGKGFSVVASEVGKLAEKSADAVSQTTQMIENSINIAEESVEIANKTAESFKTINSSIENVAKLCADIAEVSKTQATSLKNTAMIITDISGVVQNNAAYAEENTAVATNLKELSSKLKKVMTRYRLRNQDNCPVTYINGSEKVDREYLKKLFHKLKLAYSIEDVDSILSESIQGQNDFECLYVIDGLGNQFSHTIMNPDITIEQEEDFKPAMPGDYYGAKKYFREAMKKQNEWYTSVEYISAATGGLCQTLSCSYEREDREKYILCIDLIIRF